MASKKSTCIRKAVMSNQFELAQIVDYRELESGNIVLIFDSGAEVVMPGGWRLDRDLNVGDYVVAYWDSDGMFHLEFAV